MEPREAVVDTKFRLLGPDPWQASPLMTLMVEMSKHWMGNTAKVEYNIKFTRHKLAPVQVDPASVDWQDLLTVCGVG